MTNFDLREALSALAEPEPAPECFERVSRWRLAAGDAEGAGRWRLWSLMPPDPHTLQLALAQAWLALGDSAFAQSLLPQQPTWEGLLALLQRQQADQAMELQLELLRDPPPLEQTSLLVLVQAWQELERPEEALQLLEPLVRSLQRRDQVVSSSLANAMAHLLEEQDRFDAAEPWWQHSLQLDPAQPWPIMRLARQALRRQHPCLCLHYCAQVLQQDPQHPHAPRLQRRALVALKARGSLVLLDPAGSAHRSWHRRQPRWRALLKEHLPDPLPDRWQALQLRRPVQPLPAQAVAELHGMQEIAVWGDADSLCLLPLLQAAPEGLRIWLLASADPLLQRHNLDHLAPLGREIEWLSWPVADPQRHAKIQALLVAHRPPLELDPALFGADPLIWQECAGPHRWERV